MTDVKINADLTEAIEKLSEKLGIAANEIIPHYTRLSFIRGVSWVLAGLCLALIPWFYVWPISLSKEELDEGYYFLCGVKWAVCGGLSVWGGYLFFEYFENLIAPKALAVNRLLNQITVSSE